MTFSVNINLLPATALIALTPAIVLPVRKQVTPFFSSICFMQTGAKQLYRSTVELFVTADATIRTLTGRPVRFSQYVFDNDNE